MGQFLNGFFGLRIIGCDIFAIILGNEKEHLAFLEKQFEMAAWMALPN